MYNSFREDVAPWTFLLCTMRASVWWRGFSWKEWKSVLSVCHLFVCLYRFSFTDLFTLPILVHILQERLSKYIMKKCKISKFYWWNVANIVLLLQISSSFFHFFFQFNSLSLSAFPFSLRGIFYVYGRFSTPPFYHFFGSNFPCIL